MAFPSSPINGQYATVNGTTYTYSDVNRTWTRVPSTYTSSAFAVANSAAIYANGAFAQANAAYTQANTATTNAATADSKAVSAGAYANSAFLVANNAGTSAGTYANSAFGTANSAALYANGAFIQANAAFAAANTPITTGTYGGTSQIPVITVAANGRISSIANTTISIPAGTSVYGNTGQITANAATGTVALGLATTAVTAATYGGSSQIPVIVIDAYGRITSAANVASAGGGGGGVSLTDDTASNFNTYYPLMSYNATTGTLSTANTSSTKLYFNPSTGTLNSTIFNALSDQAVKKNPLRIIDALSKLSTLGGYTYLMVDNDEPSAGLIAQEVQKVLPEAVKYNPETGLLSLNYNAVLGLVVESINELEKRVSGLENDN